MDGSPGAAAAFPHPAAWGGRQRPPACLKEPRFDPSPGRAAAGIPPAPADVAAGGAGRWRCGGKSIARLPAQNPPGCPLPAPSRGCCSLPTSPALPGTPGWQEGGMSFQLFIAAGSYLGMAGATGGVRTKKGLRRKGRKAAGLCWPCECCVMPVASAGSMGPIALTRPEAPACQKPGEREGF